MPAWAIPPYVLSFTGNQLSTSLLPVPSFGINGIDYSGQSAKFYSNAFHNAMGNLQFFIVDGNIYDKEGYVIALADNILFPEFANPEFLIVPVPGSFCKYYLIYADGLADGCNPNVEVRLAYNIIDVCEPNLTNPNAGGVLLLHENTIQPEIKLAAGRRLKQVEMAVQGPTHNGNFYLFLYARFDLFMFEISQQGIIQLNKTINFLHFNTGSGYQMHLMDNNTEMEAILMPNGNYRMALNFAYLEDGIPNKRGHIYWTADFDAELNQINGSEKYFKNATETYDYYPKGMEFTPNGELLYITQRNTNPPVQYFIVNQFENGPIPFPVQNAQAYEQGFIEMGYDGKMYFASAGGLGVLSNPESPSIQNWSVMPLPIESTHKSISPCHIRREVFALPDQIDGFFYTGINSLSNQQLDIKIYPNPAKESVLIDVPVEGVLEICHADGKVVMQKELDRNVHTIHINQLSNGVYFLRFISEKGISVKRLLVLD